MEYILQFLSHPVVAPILLIGILIFVHEAGHFVVGKFFKVPVETFAIGIGPSLFKIHYRETLYRIGAIPLGGYVKFYGAHPSEEVPDKLKGREYIKVPPSKRIPIIASGPLANFLLAIIVYAGMSFYGIPDLPSIVGEIKENSPAHKAGLQFRDRIIEIDGQKVETWSQMQKLIAVRPLKATNIKVTRDNRELDLLVTPEKVPRREIIGSKYKGMIGIAPNHIPAIITVTDPTGAAHKAGLITGDRVTALEIAGKRYPIQYYRHFVAEIHKAWSQGHSGIDLWIKRQKGELPPERGGAELAVHLALKAPIPAPQMKDSQIAQALGFYHSGLTIKGVKDENFATNLKPLDRILAWDGHPVTNIFQFHEATTARNKPSVTVKIQRDGKILELDIALKGIETQKAEGKVIVYTLPVSFLSHMEHPEPITIRRSFGGALWFGVSETASQTAMVADAAIGLFTGRVPLKALGGPISIGKVASDSVKMGWMAFFNMMALISINLGLLNLFPIPILDGGQLVLLGTEIAIRRPLSQITIENFQKVGFVLILALVIMATYNDLSRFWTSMLEGVKGFFE